MKFALIGQDIPMLLPTLLTDLLFAGNEAADVAVQENNPAMQGVLKGYMDAIYRKRGIGGEALVSSDMQEVLAEADCVVFADDCMPASRFRMDREALSGEKDDDPGLSDQARVNGGIGGLMHTLRCGEKALSLCDDMSYECPDALVINLAQPMARICAVFENAGFRCYGLGRTPLRGPNGLEGLCHALHRKPNTVNADIAGLPGFAFLLSLTDAANGADLLPAAQDAAEHNDLGRLARRWLDWYGALPMGRVTDHAEFLPAQPDYIPEEDPQFGETVEQRKERILYMNTVADHGADEREGMIAQLMLLSKAPAQRPMQLALALLKGYDLSMPAVTRRNRGVLPQLENHAMIEATLTLKAGEDVSAPRQMPDALAETMNAVDETNCLAARAAAGDRSALREVVEIDPALEGLDRLYVQDVVEKMIEMHGDVLQRL